jgi:hypothetical protein
MAKKKIVSIDRRVGLYYNKTYIQAYPIPRYFKIFVAFANKKEMNKSAALKHIIEQYFNKNFSASELEYFINHFNSLTDEQIKRPGKWDY